MASPDTPLPTDAELSILNVLWARGPSTVRQVADALESTKAVGYTTVLKMLQLMHGKGIVTRDERQRNHVYAAAAPREQTQGALLGDLTQRAFGGSAARLMLRALDSAPVPAEERARIRALLQGLEDDEEEGS
jgi:BlaI family transcriptional regulator, penicillinase repressor